MSSCSIFAARPLSLVVPALLLLAMASTPVSAQIPNIRLTIAPASSARPRIAFDPQANVVVVWQDGRFGNDEILWQKFDQLGNAITAVVRVTNTPAASRFPDISCDANGVSHIAWQEGEDIHSVGTVFFCRLDAVGTKILNDVQIPVTSCGHPQVAALTDGSTDLAFFRTSGVIDFYTLYRRYSPAGALVCAKQLGASFTAEVLSPTIATSSAGSANVFWLEIPSFSYEVRSGTVASCGNPSIATIAGASSTTRTTTAIGGPFLFRMFDAGGNIQNVLGPNNVCQISQGAGQASAPSVGADANDGYVVWRDNRDVASGEIYLARFWSCTNRSGDVRLTNDPAASVDPDIAVDPAGTGNWVTVWCDSRDGNSEIYLTSRVLMDGPTPAAPGNTQASLAGCPPAAHVSWTDLSSNETSFIVERDVNDDENWLPGATLPAGSQAWDDPSIGYGNMYRYRVKACNGTFCSDWAAPASLPVSEPVLLREGVVKATILDRPFSDPVLRPIPNARVSVYRDGSPIFSTYTDPTTGVYQIVASMRCNDEIGVSLEDEFRHFHMVDWNEHHVSVCEQAAAPVLKQPIGNGSTIDFTWPIVGEGYSGDPVNVFYSYSRAVADYWSSRIGVADDEWLDFFCRVNVPSVEGGMGVNALGQAGRSCGSYQTGYGKYKSGILHEFGHRMINQKVGGPALRENLDPAHHPEAAEAAALDEGLADYFAAATDEDPRIHTRMFRTLGVEVALVLRDLSKLKLYPWCNGAYATQDEHYGGWTLGGALWDLRGRLAAIPDFDRFELDRTVYATIASLKILPVQERTIRKLRDNLLATPLGQDHLDDFTWAFDRHNIKPAPDDACRPSPQVTAVSSTVEPGGRAVSVSWSSVPYATGYRLYVGRFAQSSTGLGPGEVVADSLVDTTYSYTEPDTTVLLAFRVAALDSAGDAGPVGVETPAVTAVGPVPIGGTYFRIQLVPNPVFGPATIRVSGAPAGQISVQIFDVAGRLVRVLQNDGRNLQTVTWDCRGSDGRRMAGGAYFIRARIANAEAWGRVVVLR